VRPTRNRKHQGDSRIVQPDGSVHVGDVGFAETRFAITPGGIKTPGTGEMNQAAMEAFEARIPMRRMGNPDDIGRAALYLASELSAYITGAQIVVDGGRLLA
jgi:enoyl-[acyl-carrier-protein] reductase (NADH)